MRALWAHPQLAARDRWREVGTPASPVPALLPPAGSDAFEVAMGPVPSLGEHRRAILGELGYGEDAIGRLVESGAV
jgi:itaconate CoA-transferase